MFGFYVFDGCEECMVEVVVVWVLFDYVGCVELVYVKVEVVIVFWIVVCDLLCGVV